MSRDDPSTAAAVSPTCWSVPRVASPPALEPPVALPAPGALDWKPLVRHQRADQLTAGLFNPGWARIGWTPAGLVVDLAFTALVARNRARRLNERTHLLGDVGEIFLQWLGADRYIEIHVTPENQRLQLAWNAETLEAVRTKQAALEDIAVPDPNWVQSVTHSAASFWSARAIVPAATILDDASSLSSDTALLAVVCRYDYSGGASPVLSSTADFRGQPFHLRGAWDRLRLLP